MPWPNALAGVLTSALIFAALFVRWRSVPLVLAFHAGMNLMQETLSLRSSGLTIFEPTFGAATPRQSAAVLVFAAVINVSIAAAILLSARNVGAEAE